MSKHLITYYIPKGWRRQVVEMSTDRGAQSNLQKHLCFEPRILFLGLYMIDMLLYSWIYKEIYCHFCTLWQMIESKICLSRRYCWKYCHMVKEWGVILLLQKEKKEKRKKKEKGMFLCTAIEWSQGRISGKVKVQKSKHGVLLFD